MKLSRITEMTLADIRRVEKTQDFGYNSITGSSTDSLNPVDQWQMIQDCYFEWLKNPIANTMIELMLDFVLGDGVTYEAKDETLKDVLDEFWYDSDNSWDIQGENRIRDLFLYGEMFLKKYESKFTNSVKMISIYPGNVKEVYRDIRNTEIIDSFTFSGIEDNNKQKVIRENEKTGLLEGDIFYFKINSTTHQTRGLSDLYTSRDWLHMYDKALYSTMERIGLLLSFVYDISIKGANEQQLRDKLKSIQKNPPQPGGVRVHNDNEVWNNITPSLNGRDFEDVFRLFKSQPIAGSRMPEHFFGMGGDVNRATALSMNTPFYRKVKRRQKYIKYMFEQIFDYVIQQAQVTGILAKDNNEYKVILPEPDKEFAINIAETLFKFSNALITLTSNNLMDKQTAMTILNTLIGQMGVEINEDSLDEQSEDLYSKVSNYMQQENKKK